MMPWCDWAISDIDFWVYPNSLDCQYISVINSSIIASVYFSLPWLLSGQNNDSKMFMVTSGSYKFKMINIRMYEICTAEFWALWREKYKIRII